MRSGIQPDGAGETARKRKKNAHSDLEDFTKDLPRAERQQKAKIKQVPSSAPPNSRNPD